MEYTQSVGRGGLVKARTGLWSTHNQLVGEGWSRPGLGYTPSVGGGGEGWSLVWLRQEAGVADPALQACRGKACRRVRLHLAHPALPEDSDGCRLAGWGLPGCQRDYTL